MLATIKITLSRDRTKLGSGIATDENGVVLAGPFPCLCLSDNQAAIAAGNPTHDPLKPMGDLPTGTYHCTIVGPADPERSYGPGQRILLIGIEGDALIAGKVRSGLLDHGGDLNPAYTQWRGLRPTHGCCRWKNEDLVTIIKAVEKFEEIEQAVEEI